MTSEEAEKIMQTAVDKLGEHFDSVQILCTWVEGGVTRFLPRGSGDWYARQGACHEFINREIASDTATQIANRLKEGED